MATDFTSKNFYGFAIELLIMEIIHNIAYTAWIQLSYLQIQFNSFGKKYDYITEK
jgi:hypothetical protein